MHFQSSFWAEALILTWYQAFDTSFFPKKKSWGIWMCWVAAGGRWWGRFGKRFVRVSFPLDIQDFPLGQSIMTRAEYWQNGCGVTMTLIFLQIRMQYKWIDVSPGKQCIPPLLQNTSKRMWKTINLGSKRASLRNNPSDPSPSLSLQYTTSHVAWMGMLC